MRPIDADALIDRLDYCVKEGMGSTIAFTFKHMVEDAPTIDAVSVVHGEWIEHKNAEEICGTLISNYECSLCHEWQTLISNFCPSCGARMRGVSDETANNKSEQ